MGKILCLDLGDVWVGIAISDALGIVAQPLKTIKAFELEDTLKELLKKEPISKVVVGYPQTLRGTISEQTKKIVAEKNRLEKLFSEVTWVLWDERLSSKQAERLKKIKTKADKIASHSIAAALILENYLQMLSM